MLKNPQVLEDMTLSGTPPTSLLYKNVFLTIYIPMYSMSINICLLSTSKKTFFYSNEVGGALRGTRQGPVLEYLWYCIDHAHRPCKIRFFSINDTWISWRGIITPFFNFLFTYLFSIKFLYIFIQSFMCRPKKGYITLIVNSK